MKESGNMTRQTRREFLENSMFATAAAVAAGTAKEPVLRAAEKESSPNEKLRVAVLGVRGRGQSHLKAFVQDRQDCEVVAIVDPDETVGQTKGVAPVTDKQGKAPAYYKDLRRVMDDDSIDVVSIATPNHWHALAAIWAIQAGKDVYVEKPVSHNISEGRRIVQAARKHDSIVQTGTQCRSTGGTNAAIEYIHAGKIGEVNLARGLCYKPRGTIGPRGVFDVSASVDYNLWLGPAPEKPLTRPKLHYDWHWYWDTGNGDLGNQGIHQMDLARWGLGVSDLGRGVVSYGGRLGYVDAGETANSQVTMVDYGRKTLVFEVRGLKTDSLRGAKVGVIFYGTEGYLVLNNYNGGAAFDLDGNVIESFSAPGDHFGNFVQAVYSRNVNDLNADIEEGHLSSALCHLGNISYHLGSEITTAEAAERLTGSDEGTETLGRFSSYLKDNGLDLEQTKIRFGAQLALDGEREVFTGDLADKANAQLTRDYRKPFVVPTAAEL
jgi:predicted dehydrogenase